jgi:hypothetical protein
MMWQWLSTGMENQQMRTLISLIAAVFLTSLMGTAMADDTDNDRLERAEQKVNKKTHQAGQKIEKGGKKIQREAEEEMAEDNAENQAEKAEEARKKAH